MSFVGKTKSEQMVEHFSALKRPLTDAESEDLRRAMHAAYEHRRRSNALAMHATEEANLLKRMEREALLPSDFRMKWVETQGKRPRTGDKLLHVRFKNGEVSKQPYRADQMRFTKAETLGTWLPWRGLNEPRDNRRHDRRWRFCRSDSSRVEGGNRTAIKVHISAESEGRGTATEKA
jgi:hypothetical protein